MSALHVLEIVAEWSGSDRYEFDTSVDYKISEGMDEDDAILETYEEATYGGDFDGSY